MADGDVQAGQEDRSTQAAHVPRGPKLRLSLRYLTAAWLFGAVWMTATSGAPLTQFARELGASEFQFGLLAALPFMASLLSVPASILIDRTGKRKLIFLIGLYVQRLMWVPIALVPLTLARVQGTGPSSTAMIVFLIMIFVMFSGQTVGGTAWVSWMADLVPDRSRGKYFGRRRSWGMVTTIPAAVIVGIVLDHFAPAGGGLSQQLMNVCGFIFIAASAFGVMDIALHHPIPEIKAKPVKHPHPLASLAKPLRDKNFLWFAGFVGTIYFAISFMGQFVSLYLIEKLKVTNLGTQLMLLAVPALAQLMVLSVWGHMVDRFGKKPVLAIAALGLVPVGFGWCFMDTGAIWLGYLLTATGAMLFCGVEVANLHIMLEMSGTEDNEGAAGSSYAAVNTIIVNIAGCMGGLSAGFIADALKGWTWDIGILGMAPIGFYEVLFALSGVMRLLAVVVFLPRVHEPDARPVGEALRFMTTNIYNNLFSVVTVPLRAIGRRDEARRLKVDRERMKTES